MYLEIDIHDLRLVPLDHLTYEKCIDCTKSCSHCLFLSKGSVLAAKPSYTLIKEGPILYDSLTPEGQFSLFLQSDLINYVTIIMF